MKSTLFAAMFVLVMGCFPSVKISRPAPEFAFTDLTSSEIIQKSSALLILNDFDIQIANSDIGVLQASNKKIGHITDKDSGFDKETSTTHSSYIICAYTNSPTLSEMTMSISIIPKDSVRNVTILSKVLSPNGNCASNGELEQMLHKLLTK